MGSVLPAEHPAWDDPEVVTKNFTSEGGELAAQILDFNVDFVYA